MGVDIFSLSFYFKGTKVSISYIHADNHMQFSLIKREEKCSILSIKTFKCDMGDFKTHLD